MSPAQPLKTHSDDSEPLALSDRAADNLRYIRRTMENAGSFTAVPGWGVCVMGLVGLGAAWLSRDQAPDAWLQTWLWAAVLAVAAGGLTMARKARAAKLTLLSGPGRKFALSLAPALLAGAILTSVLHPSGAEAPHLMAGLWLLLYGVGVTTAGAFSIRIVPVMGLSFMAVGIAALFSPAAWTTLWAGIGFGGLHVIFGLMIARRYGG